MGVLAIPFDRAANGIGQGHADRSAGQVFFEGVFEIVDGDLAGIAGAIDGPAGIDKLAIAAENEKVRGPQRAIDPAGLLRTVA